MHPAAAPASLTGALDLLERAVGYTRVNFQLVSRDDMARSTPCSAWNLGDLLHHMNDSLIALQEAADRGVVAVTPSFADDSPDIVATLRVRACALLSAWTQDDGTGLVSVAGRPVTAELLVGTGALEIAVHGWDVAQACGRQRRLPHALSEELLELAPALVSSLDRPARFAPAIQVPPSAPPGDRLLAFLGRAPAG